MIILKGENIVQLLCSIIILCMEVLRQLTVIIIGSRCKHASKFDQNDRKCNLHNLQSQPKAATNFF